MEKRKKASRVPRQGHSGKGCFSKKGTPECLGWGHGALGEGLFKNNGKCSSLSAWDEALGEEDFLKKKRWTAPTA
jgi:hypothetical protein